MKAYTLILRSLAAILLYLMCTATSAEAATLEILKIKDQDFASTKYKIGGAGPFNFFLVGRATDAQLKSLSDADLSKLMLACRGSVNSGEGGGCGFIYDVIQESPTAKKQYEGDLYDVEREEAGGYALKLFNYSMGQTGGVQTPCISCPFLANFIVAISDFSKATFAYFQGLFNVLAPSLMTIWVLYGAILLFFGGGEGGRQYTVGVVKKMTLFFFAWALISGGSASPDANNPASWQTAGPKFLASAFQLSAETREKTLSFSHGFLAEGGDLFTCDGMNDYVGTFTSDFLIQGFGGEALKVACVTERTHMIGIASSLAVIGSSWTNVPWSVAGIFTAVVKLVAGIFLLSVYGFSMIWFTFLVLDVIVRGMITAAFLPVFAGFYLFRPTRKYAAKAIEGLVGAIVSAVAISIISTLAFFLMSQTVFIYNDIYASMGTVYGVLMTEIPEADVIESFREFIIRIQESDPEKPSIPMDLSTPWFHYLVLCGLSIFALGKKIIAMLEGFVGHVGSSAMADSALKSARQSTNLAVAGGTAAIGLGLAGAAALAVPGGGFLAGAAGNALAASANPFARVLGDGIGKLRDRPAIPSRYTSGSKASSLTRSTVSGGKSVLNQATDVNGETPDP